MYNIPNVRCISLSTTFFLLILNAFPVFAEALYLTGGEMSRTTGYLYLGRLASLEGNSLQPGLAYRLWADRITYEYKSGAITHQATLSNVSAGIGKLFQSDTFSGSGFINLVEQRTSISPDDLSNDARGSHTTASVSGDLTRRLGEKWYGLLGASYIVRNHNYWTRLRIMHDLEAQRSVGFEYVMMGGPNYSISQTGVVWSGLNVGPAKAAFKGGMRQVSGESTTAYAGVELSASF